jgi:aminoglycoside phosphotransferase (APT) family kinase protein
MINLLKAHPFFSDKQIDSCDRLENQGHCNENYLVVADGLKYIIRKLLRDDIDRAFEWKVQDLAYAQGITAKPLVFDRENGFMVFVFLEGEHKSKLDENVLKLLAQILKKLHSISIDVKPIELQTDMSSVECYPKEYVLCHNDLTPQNIFFSKDIKFIDWEYAGINDRYFDLACICVEFGLAGEMVEFFLRVYFDDNNFSLEKLEAYKVIYRSLCEEWFQSNL